MTAVEFQERVKRIRSRSAALMFVISVKMNFQRFASVPGTLILARLGGFELRRTAPNSGPIRSRFESPEGRASLELVLEVIWLMDNHLVRSRSVDVPPYSITIIMWAPKSSDSKDSLARVTPTATPYRCRH